MAVVHQLLVGQWGRQLEVGLDQAGQVGDRQLELAGVVPAGEQVELLPHSAHLDSCQVVGERSWQGQEHFGFCPRH